MTVPVALRNLSEVDLTEQVDGLRKGDAIIKFDKTSNVVTFKRPHLVRTRSALVF